MIGPIVRGVTFAENLQRLAERGAAVQIRIPLIGGVNLDDEAAALIRYQQAYQACAKALQVSGDLFDSIVQIR